MTTDTTQQLLFGSPVLQTAPHLFVGWEKALASLTGKGRRWLISPWLTTDLPSAVLRSGDRIIVRGAAKDFYHSFSNLDALVKLEAIAGVEIRRLPNLHAKVYVQEADSNSSGSLWLGSANLSQVARFGDGDKGNIEAMAGPLVLDETFEKALQHLWKMSKPVKTAQLSEECERYAQTRQAVEKLLSDFNQLVLAVRLSFRITTGTCTIKAQWLGLDPNVAPWDSISYPSVPYFALKSDLYKKWRGVFDRARRDLLKGGLLAKVEGVTGRGLYALRVQDKAILENSLQNLGEKIEKELLPELKRSRKELLEDFVERFQPTYEEFSNTPRLQAHQVDENSVLEAAKYAFLEFTLKHPFSIEAEYFLPLPTPERPTSDLNRAIDSAFERNPLALGVYRDE